MAQRYMKRLLFLYSKNEGDTDRKRQQRTYISCIACEGTVFEFILYASLLTQLSYIVSWKFLCLWVSCSCNNNEIFVYGEVKKTQWLYADRTRDLAGAPYKHKIKDVPWADICRLISILFHNLLVYEMLGRKGLLGQFGLFLITTCHVPASLFDISFGNFRQAPSNLFAVGP